MAESLFDIAAGAEPSRAVGAPGRPWLGGAGLRRLVEEIGRTLNDAGVGRNDRVGMVLANGPDAATAFLGVAACATAAPLNPAYRADEFRFYLSDLRPKAVILQEGADTPARAIAGELGVAVIDLLPRPDAPAGSFALGPAPGGGAANGGPAGPADIALVLHTSGTTARPKIVPLSNRNLAASARHVGASLALRPSDVCLNVMPLFHIHGLVAAVLSSLAAGASVCCTPGFNALRFLGWLEEVKPTWYTAVPTMHQAILMRARQHPDQARAAGLRLIRSSSASLPPQVMAELEEVFGAPVIEAYGMTEAAHQMSSNPLPPRARRPGCVGLAAGPEIAVMDEAGRLLPPGGIGEVVIRGPNVTAGYAANPEANAKAFSDGWFRTGDQGVLDTEGYLTLTGRLKELINRGGEKISPLEVDTVLMDHPAVAQVVTFAMPHDKLGEEVAAAVVLRDGAAASESDIRDFCAERLAPFKVPRRVLFMADIPKGATGKLQRIGLAAKLGVAG
ncbi:MAG: AMP-binding protein [Acidisphaera sp.]|nr:AMP-binding protein [Acidisphaera sp.]